MVTPASGLDIMEIVVTIREFGIKEAYHGNSWKIKVNFHRGHQYSLLETKMCGNLMELSFDVMKWASSTAEQRWIYRVNTQTLKSISERKRSLRVGLYIVWVVKVVHMWFGASCRRPSDHIWWWWVLWVTNTLTCTFLKHEFLSITYMFVLVQVLIQKGFLHHFCKFI